MNRQFIGTGFSGANTVSQFCDANNVSRTLFYELLKRGKGPRIFKAGRRTLVSTEAGADWRAQMEAEAAGQSQKAA